MIENCDKRETSHLSPSLEKRAFPRCFMAEPAIELQIIQTEFEGYVRSVYGTKPLPGSDQYEHLRGAFFGGALVAFDRDPDQRVDLRRELEGFGVSAPIAKRPLH
jgi:hypothetical protein